jgi:O-antigen biosynthesis protein
MASKSSPLPIIWLSPGGCLEEQRPPDGSALDHNAWYLFTDRDTRLHPRIAEIVHACTVERPEIDIFYGDEVVVQSSSVTSELHLCKPSFDRTQIIAQDYIGWPIVVRGRALARLGGPDKSAGSAITYDLILRAMSEGIGIERITEVLAVHQQLPPRSSIADRAAALDGWRQRSAVGYEIHPGMVAGTFRLQRDFATLPDVTLVVPTRQGFQGLSESAGKRLPMILDFLESLCVTKWPMERLSVLVGDDEKDGSIYEMRPWPFRLERIVTNRQSGEPFNYAAKMNRLWRMARDEYLVLMNDDLVVRNPEWLLALMTFATSEEIGGVGARLLYPDDRIQHVGVPAGVFESCTHAFVGRPVSQRSYQNWAEVHREWSIVTGAVFAVRKSVLHRINGFDETFALDYNDVDMCLRLRLLGYRVVYTPYAEFTHFESASRTGMDTPGDQLALFIERWRDFIMDDPAYHPGLTRTSSDIVPVRRGYNWWEASVGMRGVQG